MSKPKTSSNERIIRYEGGSLVLSIPKWIAKKHDWYPGDTVKIITVGDNTLIVEKISHGRKIGV